MKPLQVVTQVAKRLVAAGQTPVTHGPSSNSPRPLTVQLMGLTMKRGTSWWETYARCVDVAPEAFDSDRLHGNFPGYSSYPAR
jgi:hypothetical protein